MKTIAELQIDDIKVRNNRPSFEASVDYPSKCEWMIQAGTVLVSGKWLLKNSTIEADGVNESEYYETTLTEIGVKNIEDGTYGIDVEKTIKIGSRTTYEIQGGQSFKEFIVLIKSNWVKVYPRDYKGLYNQAKDLGY